MATLTYSGLIVMQHQLVDVVQQCEGTLIKIGKYCYKFYPIFQFFISTRAKF